MHPFFSEFEAKQRMQIFQREAQAERGSLQVHDATGKPLSHRAWTIGQTGLTAFGAGLLIGSFLVRFIGPAPIVVMAGCVSVMTTLSVLVS